DRRNRAFGAGRRVPKAGALGAAYRGLARQCALLRGRTDCPAEQSGRVPGSPNRDRLLGALPVWLMLASTILRKAHYRSIWERPLLSIVDLDLKELSWERATLWFRDNVFIFRADLITEVGYLGVLSYLVFVAAS